ncbi:MAG: STAS domain-containing protein [Thiohalobacterales bacterium]|nr:STAS domain-containing protein [Thiohalobacterales bacterium]
MAEAGIAVSDDCWRLSGDLDFATVPALLGHRGAEMRAGSNIRVDLSAVTRTDSAGLALMVEWLREAERTGLVMTFENVPEQLQSIARVSGLEEILFVSNGGDGPDRA